MSWAKLQRESVFPRDYVARDIPTALKAIQHAKQFTRAAIELIRQFRERKWHRNGSKGLDQVEAFFQSRNGVLGALGHLDPTCFAHEIKFCK